MAKQTINIGSSPNDGTGTPLRTSFDYCNLNFTELYTATGPSGNNIVCPGSATITGDLTVDTSTLKVDSANDNVGIGTTTPASYAFNDPVKLVIANTGTAGAGNTFTIASGSTGFGQIAFANGTSGTSRYNGYIKYSHSTNAMEFYTTAGALQATLNSTGLGVGVVPTVGKVQTNGAFATTGAVGSISTTPLANALIGDFNTTCRLLATGPNTTTAGVHKFIVCSSDASVFFETLTLDALGNVIIRSPATPATLTTNGQLTVNATSDTNLRFSYRGSDGVTRVANITLA